ncbi:flagellar basal body P-ring formation chaperone FlgA [Halomonas sp. IOP_31]|jgi:flagella basal body P-ring formation protein FlgA|uniref:flagellar basal body P-ring formation chaperone FlgA n=1 Tax=Halomonas sp. IOP_31 TaxID=2876584 RepID=UPI001E5340F1|nr:flagellar basal body P-ring formation chaperone FlgA [Halomonas sp. IOP_31]MCD6008881.1 flagellar basal body P-ring formation protein FlgA [Halomonas sp. IOP_31]
MRNQNHNVYPDHGAHFIKLLAIAALIWLGAPPALADSSEEALIEQRVRDFLIEQARPLGDSVSVSVSVQRAQARLPACENPQPFLPRNNQRLYGRVAVGVDCNGEGGRTRYVQADVSVTIEHVVLARDVPRGATLTSQDLMLEKGFLEKLPRQAVKRIEGAVGLVATRALRAGTTLQSYQLRRENLVKRGQTVSVIARGEGFQVRREAQAMDNGAMGEQVRLRIANGELLQARVIGPKRLSVEF